MIQICLFALSCLGMASGQTFLEVSGTDILYNGQKVQRGKNLSSLSTALTIFSFCENIYLCIYLLCNTFFCGGGLQIQAFLSGMNLAWHSFGNDFGNGQYDCCTGAALENYLAQLNETGGNTLSKIQLISLE